MNINALHSEARTGGKAAEEKLFQALTVRFRFFAEQKILDNQDAEEVMQRALMTVFRKYQEIDFKVSFAAWAHKVLDNEILKHYRTKSVREKVMVRTADGETPSEAWHPNPDLKIKLADCMKKLCESHSRYALILGLHYQGYSAEEICKELDITFNNFYVLLSRSRNALKRCLEEGGTE